MNWLRDDFVRLFGSCHEHKWCKIKIMWKTCLWSVHLNLYDGDLPFMLPANKINCSFHNHFSSNKKRNQILPQGRTNFAFQRLIGHTLDIMKLKATWTFCRNAHSSVKCQLYVYYQSCHGVKSLIFFFFYKLRDSFAWEEVIQSVFTISHTHKMWFIMRVNLHVRKWINPYK